MTAQFGRKVHLWELGVLIKSLLRQTIAPYGYQYIRFLLRNLTRHPRVFTEAVKLAVVGHHFHVITREMIKAEGVASYLDEKYAFLCKRLEACSAQAMASYQEKRLEIERLLKQKNRILEKIQMKIDGLHVDFRRDISRKYRDLSDRLQVLFEPLEQAVIYSNAPGRNLG